MTIKEREMILNLTYLELAEKFKNEQGIIEDDYRIDFFREHLTHLHRANFALMFIVTVALLVFLLFSGGLK